MTHMVISGRSAEARVLANTPVRNEADHLEGVASSMAAQHHRPTCWVIVVNGSTDGTEAVANRIATSTRIGWLPCRWTSPGNGHSGRRHMR